MGNTIQPHNVRFITRMTRLLSLGRYQTTNYKKDVYLVDNSAKTFYLVKESMLVLSFREWHQLNGPSFIVSGSYNGCKKTKDRMIAKQKQFMTAHS